MNLDRKSVGFGSCVSFQYRIICVGCCHFSTISCSVILPFITNISTIRISSTSLCFKNSSRTFALHWASVLGILFVSTEKKNNIKMRFNWNVIIINRCLNVSGNNQCVKIVLFLRSLNWEIEGALPFRNKGKMNKEGAQLALFGVDSHRLSLKLKESKMKMQLRIENCCLSSNTIVFLSKGFANFASPATINDLADTYKWAVFGESRPCISSGHVVGLLVCPPITPDELVVRYVLMPLPFTQMQIHALGFFALFYPVYQIKSNCKYMFFLTKKILFDCYNAI